LQPNGCRFCKRGVQDALAGAVGRLVDAAAAVAPPTTSISWPSITRGDLGPRCAAARHARSCT
jgi:hypothetical protein